MAKSIICNTKECYFCGSRGNLHKHHIMGGPNRPLAEKDGLWVYLCQPHHVCSPYAVHVNRDKSLELKIEAQRAYEKLYGHDAWMCRYGRNYMEEQNAKA